MTGRRIHLIVRGSAAYTWAGNRVRVGSKQRDGSAIAAKLGGPHDLGGVVATPS